MPLAVITGASRGIGLAAARRFADDGWEVACISRSPCPDVRAHHVPTDLLAEGWEAGVGQWLASAAPEPRRIALVHNAAMLIKDEATAIDLAALRQLIELNVVVPAALNLLLRPRMAGESSILYAGSTLSEKAVPGTASYVTSKHAVAGLMKATCQDLVGVGIHTACVAPGLTATEMLLDHIGDDESARTA